MMFKKCSNFHWCILKSFNFIETVYELFDNPSYFRLGKYRMFEIFILLPPLSNPPPPNHRVCVKGHQYNPNVSTAPPDSEIPWSASGLHTVKQSISIIRAYL